MEKPRFSSVFSMVILMLSAAIIILLMFVKVPADNKELVNVCVTLFIGTGLSKAILYILGSTQSSEVKNETIKNLSEK